MKVKVTQIITVTAEVRTRLTMQRVRLEQVGQNQLLLSANIWKLVEFAA